MRTAIALLALASAACAQPVRQEDPQAQARAVLAEYGPLCEAAGFTRGTKDFQQCVVQLYVTARQQAAERRQAAGAALLGAGAAILAGPPPAAAPAPPMTCRWFAQRWVCQ